jgi:exopolyphosphatase/guanosine-5'-triphosphate,3'-diphosphate pyrophosphatase
LGDAVGSDGWLGGDRRTELATALAAYAEVARRNNARPITFLGTEPIRRALDGARIAAEVEGASAVPLHVLDHAEEAMLTLIGVTGGRPVDGELVVVDVGGGSTEIVAVGRGRSAVAAGLRLGSASLTARHVHHDPPLPDEVDRMFDEARRAMATAPDADPAEVVAVGGTASNLVRIASEPGSAGAAGPPGDGRLDRGRIEAALEVLLAEEADSAAARHGVKPIRARLLPAGAVILTAVLERYAAGGVRVSDEGIREGAVLVTVHDPIGWRDRLPELARGWIV